MTRAPARHVQRRLTLAWAVRRPKWPLPRLTALLELDHERRPEDGIQPVLPRVSRAEHDLRPAGWQRPEALVARAPDCIRVDHLDVGDDVEVGRERGLVLVQPLKTDLERHMTDDRCRQRAGGVDGVVAWMGKIDVRRQLVVERRSSVELLGVVPAQARAGESAVLLGIELLLFAIRVARAVAGGEAAPLGL